MDIDTENLMIAISELRTIAQRGCWRDNMTDADSVYDFCGGNVDDAFEGGFGTGEVFLARYMLDRLGIDWQTSGDIIG
jgi:hypothetical protein